MLYHVRKQLLMLENIAVGHLSMKNEPWKEDELRPNNNDPAIAI